MTIKISKRDVILLLNTLLLATVLVFVLWQTPWDNSNETKRTISVSGEGTVSAEADEFTFRPNYLVKADSSEDAIEQASSKANEVTEGLTELGVEDKDIEIDASTYENYWYRDDDGSYRAYVYVVVSANKDNVEDVQAYLNDTEPTGSLTPQPSFSKDKQKELEVQARDEAIANARAKAEQSASELDVEVKKVITVEESSNTFGYPYPYALSASVDAAGASEENSSFPVRTGEQEYTVVVTVKFEVK